MINFKPPKELTTLSNVAVLLTPSVIRIIIELHVEFNDLKKVNAWLLTKNMNFGNIAPLRLIQLGKADKVLKFIESAREDNLP